MSTVVMMWMMMFDEHGWTEVIVSHRRANDDEATTECEGNEEKKNDDFHQVVFCGNGGVVKNGSSLRTDTLFTASFPSTMAMRLICPLIGTLDVVTMRFPGFRIRYWLMAAATREG